jgi:hypothetical protein
MNKVILLTTLVLPLVAYARLANAELSAAEREKLHLCPKNCAPYCQDIPAHPTYCTCFCQSPEPSDTSHLNHGRKRPQQR